MSVSNLVGSFKLEPYPYGFMTNNLDETAEYIYVVGDQLIINEIKTRPTEELHGLRKLGSDKLMLLQGPQGDGESLTEKLDEILQDIQEGATNKAPR